MHCCAPVAGSPCWPPAVRRWVWPARRRVSLGVCPSPARRRPPLVRSMNSKPYSSSWRAPNRPAPGSRSMMPTLDIVTRLADRSMITMPATGRWSMLDTLREYATEKLIEFGEDLNVRGLHLGRFVELAEAARVGFDGAEQAVLLAKIDDDLDNMRAALAWSVDGDPVVGLQLASALARFWSVRGRWSEGRRWLEILLTDDAPPESRRIALSEL